MLTIVKCTPGGGGYGAPKDEKKLKPKEDPERKWAKGSVASRVAEWESSS